MADPSGIHTVGHFFENLTTSMVGIIIGLIGFWSTFIKNLVSRKEVEAMIKTQTPYAQDRHFIMERLNDSKEATNILFRALEKNTEVMTELKIQIATLSHTLSNLESRIERK
jgi:ABC-type bacteriocin/lantibiotic exporter with double-glycine peptidase domain